MRRITTTTELGAVLRDRRQQTSLTQAGVSERVGLRQATVSDFERRPDRARVETLFRLLAALEMDLYLQPKEERRKPTARPANAERW
ncbi:MAG: helix-turn-helix domain-containing protein [Gammaproteobacteria bacterium]